MTLIRTRAGWYEGDFRAKGIQRLHLALGTKNRKEAQPRHDAVHKLFKQRRTEMIDQLRSGDLTVERLEAMVEHHESLAPVPVAEAPHSWGTVDVCADAYIQWIDRHPNRRDKTTKVAAWQLAGFRAFVYQGQRVGAMDMDAVTPEMIEAYQQALVDAKAPQNTITTVMSRVGALWRFVRKREDRESQQKRRAPRPVYSPVDPERVIRNVTRRERFLTEDELARLFAETPPAARFGVYCGAMAGLRVDEMLHLRPTLDVDLDMGTLTIRDHVDPEWHPKTRRSRRTVPMAKPLLAAAREHAERWASDQWMMPTIRYKDRPLTQTGWRLVFKPIVERAGLVFGNETPQGVTYHTLRHTFASHAVMRGVDLYTVAQLLGDSLQMVEQTYAHLSPDHKRAAIQKMEAAFKVTQPVTQKPNGK